MREHRMCTPDGYPYGPVCASYALAGLTGRPIAEFLHYRGTRLVGLYRHETRAHLTRVYGRERVTGLLRSCVRRHTGKLRPTVAHLVHSLPHARGIVHTRHHALAFDGLMTLDLRGPGRWRWYMDCASATSVCTGAIIIKPNDGTPWRDVFRGGVE